MSLILEALKKAERQHKLGEVPSLGAQAGAASPDRHRGLGWLMLVLLATLMLGLGLYLGGFRLGVDEHRDGAAHVSTTKPAVSAAPPVAPPVEPPAPHKSPETVAETPPPPSVAYVTPPPPPAKPPRPLIEMPSGFVANLPPLNIDIHSYDQRPAKRYVLINMEKYREGDYLAEGPQLIEILPDGAILEHLGERFILPIGNQ